MTTAIRSDARPRWLWRFVRALTLRHLAAQALNGMLANPEWMKLAKEECSRPGCGHDVPTFFGELAARYARDALSEVEEIERTTCPNASVRHEPKAVESKL